MRISSFHKKKIAQNGCRVADLQQKWAKSRRYLKYFKCFALWTLLCFITVMTEWEREQGVSQPCCELGSMRLTGTDLRSPLDLWWKSVLDGSTTATFRSREMTRRVAEPTCISPTSHSKLDTISDLSEHSFFFWCWSWDYVRHAMFEHLNHFSPEDKLIPFWMEEVVWRGSFLFLWNTIWNSSGARDEAGGRSCPGWECEPSFFYCTIPELNESSSCTKSTLLSAGLLYYAL